MSFNGDVLAADTLNATTGNISGSTTTPVDDILLFISSSGDDSADGSVTSPIASLERAFQIIAQTGYNNSAVITVADPITLTGDVFLPKVDAGQQRSPITVLGATPTATYTSAGNTTFSFVGNITTRATASLFIGNPLQDESRQLYITDTDGSFTGPDTAGRFVRFTSGNLSAFQSDLTKAANPVVATIREPNSAQTLAVNFFTGSNLPAAGDNYEIVELTSTINLTDAKLYYSNNVVFQNCICVVGGTTGLSTIPTDNASKLIFNTCRLDVTADLQFAGRTEFGGDLFDSAGVLQSNNTGSHFIVTAASTIMFKSTEINPTTTERESTMSILIKHSNFTGDAANTIKLDGVTMNIFASSFIDCQELNVFKGRHIMDSVYFGNTNMVKFDSANIDCNGLCIEGSNVTAGNSALMLSSSQMLISSEDKLTKGLKIDVDLSCVTVDNFSDLKIVMSRNSDSPTNEINCSFFVTNDVAGDGVVKVLGGSKMQIRLTTEDFLSGVLSGSSFWSQADAANTFNVENGSFLDFEYAVAGLVVMNYADGSTASIFNSIDSTVTFREDPEIFANGLSNGAFLLPFMPTANSRSITVINCDNSDILFSPGSETVFFSESLNLIGSFFIAVNKSIVNLRIENTRFDIGAVGNIFDNSQFNIFGNIEANKSPPNVPGPFFTGSNGAVFYVNDEVRIINFDRFFECNDCTIKGNMIECGNFTSDINGDNIFTNCNFALEQLIITSTTLDSTFTGCKGSINNLDRGILPFPTAPGIQFDNCNMAVTNLIGFNLLVTNGSLINITQFDTGAQTLTSGLVVNGGSRLIFDNIVLTTIPQPTPFITSRDSSEFIITGGTASTLDFTGVGGTIMDLVDSLAVFITNITITGGDIGIYIEKCQNINLRECEMSNGTTAGLSLNQCRGVIERIVGTGNGTGLIVSNNSTILADTTTNITGLDEVIVGSNSSSVWVNIQGGFVDDITDLGSFGVDPRQNCTLTAN